MRSPRPALTMAFLAAALGLSGPATGATKPPRPLFAATDTLHLTLRGPIDALEATSGRSAKPLPATLTVEGASPETLAVALSTRGVMRGNRDVCPFPPLRVTFPQPPASGSLFAGQKGLKLVTHCQSDAGFQHYLLLEYTAYRLYQTLTPASFGVRLASIDYAGPSGRKIVSRLAFFIEDAHDVARRDGLKHVKTKNHVPVAALAPADAARFAMFEDMIGNLDWAMIAGPAGSDCCHNARLFAAREPASPGATPGLVPVPYDFDFAGLVDAPYATPPEGIRLPNVRVRLYRGFCRHNAEARVAAADLLARRAALVEVIATTPELTGFVRHKATQYLDGFFDSIATPAKVDAVLKTCVG